MPEPYDVLPVGARPGDMEVAMGGTPAKLADGDGESLAATDPHEIERLLHGHRRMERPWAGFDFAVDASEVYDRKLEALATYESVFSGDRTELVDLPGAEDRHVVSLVGTPYAEPYEARSPLLVRDPGVLDAAPYG